MADEIDDLSPVACLELLKMIFHIELELGCWSKLTVIRQIDTQRHVHNTYIIK